MFTTITKGDVRFNDLVSNHFQTEILPRLPQLTLNGPWIAGGILRQSILNERRECDVDCFFQSETQRQQFETELLANGAYKKYTNEFNSTFILPSKEKVPQLEVQCIFIQYYPTLQAVLDTFDYTICQFGFDGNTLICGPFSLYDLARKRLVLHKLTHGPASLRRALKYASQGYTLCVGAAASLLKATVENPQVIDVEPKYFD